MRLLTSIALAGATILSLTASAVVAVQQCWVGVKYDDSTDYSIACTQIVGTGAQILQQTGYGRIMFGPGTWDACAAWVEANIAPASG